MAINKNLKKRLNDEQTQAYLAWEERWKGKRWNNQRADELLAIVLPGYVRVGGVDSLMGKVQLCCDKGHNWITSMNSIKAGNQCSMCSLERQIRPAEGVYQSIKEKHGYALDMDTYKGMHKPARFKCQNNNWFWGKPTHVEKGMKKCPCNPCKEARGRRKNRTKQEFIKELKESGFILNPEDWKGSRVKTKVWCIEGQHWTEQQPSGILNNGYGCVICSGNVKHTLEELQEKLYGLAGYRIREGIVYKNNRTPIPLWCPKGHECEISVNHFKEGVRCKQCYIENMTGENNPKWNHNLTDEERKKIRITTEYFVTRDACFARDNWTCRITGKRGRVIHHHLDGFHWCVERRYDLNNVVTLSEEIHEEFHNKYGRGDNTRDQFIEFLESLIKENRFHERKQHILALIDWIEETRDKMDFNHLEDIKQIAG